MKRIKSTFFLFMALFLLLDGCESYKGNATEVTKTQPQKTEVINTNTQENQTIHLTDNEVKDILHKLIPKAVDIYGMFNGTGFYKFDTKETIPGEKQYCLITGISGGELNAANNAKSITDLKNIVEGVFTKDIAQKIFYTHYFESKDIGLPLYKEYEGRLYVNTNNGGHGWATDFLIDTAKLKNQKDNVAEIELDTTVLDKPSNKLTIRIESINDKWLLASRLD